MTLVCKYLLCLPSKTSFAELDPAWLAAASSTQHILFVRLAPTGNDLSSRAAVLKMTLHVRRECAGGTCLGSTPWAAVLSRPAEDTASWWLDVLAEPAWVLPLVRSISCGKCEFASATVVVELLALSFQSLHCSTTKSAKNPMWKMSGARLQSISIGVCCVWCDGLAQPLETALPGPATTAMFWSARVFYNACVMMEETCRMVLSGHLSPFIPRVSTSSGNNSLPGSWRCSVCSRRMRAVFTLVPNPRRRNHRTTRHVYCRV